MESRFLGVLLGFLQTYISIYNLESNFRLPMEPVFFLSLKVICNLDTSLFEHGQRRCPATFRRAVILEERLPFLGSNVLAGLAPVLDETPRACERQWPLAGSRRLQHADAEDHRGKREAGCDWIDWATHSDTALLKSSSWM